MPVTLGPNGELVEVGETPDRVTPAPAPTGDGSTLNAALENSTPQDERRVQLVNDAGDVFEVGEGGVATALEQNRSLRLATPEEVHRYDTRGEREGAIATLKGIGSTVAAGALDAALAPANLVDLATGGRGDASGRKFLESVVALGAGSNERAREYTEEQRRWAEEHPLAHGAAHVVGTALGGMPLGRAVAGGAEALGLGEAATMTAAGAVEGGAQGIAGASEDAYIRNADLTGEQMLAAMGWGALIGGGTGLAVSKGGQLLFGRAGSRGSTPFDAPRITEAGEGVAASPFGERFAEKLRGFSEERVTKAIGARGSDIAKLGKSAPAAEAEMRRMARDVLEGKLEDGTPIFKAIQSQDQLVGNLVRAREEAGAALGAFRERVGSYIDDEARALRPKPAEIADRIEREVIAPLRGSVIPQVARRADDVQGVVDGLRSLGDDVSLAQLQGVRQELASVVYPKKVGPGLPPPPPASAAELQRAERIIEDSVEATIDRATTKMGGADLGKYAELKGKFRSYREAAQIAGKADLQDLGNRVVSPSDYMAGIGGAVLGGDPITGAVTAAVHKTVREHSSSVLAVLADRLAQTVDRKITKGVDSFFERALGQAAKARPANDVLPAAASRPKLAPVAGRAAAAVATPLALFMGKEKNPQKAYRQRVDEVLQANANFGERIRNRTQATLGDLPTKAPKLAAAVATTATRGAQFLATKIPAATVNPQSFTPRTSALPVSDVELRKFAMYWSAVANPASVLQDFARGRVAPEQVEALRAVFPELYGTIVTKVQTTLRTLDMKGTPVPYSARLQLDMLLGLKGAGEPTASPRFVQLFQQIQAQSEAQGGQHPGPKPPARPINIASRLRSGRDAIDPGAPKS